MTWYREDFVKSGGHPDVVVFNNDAESKPERMPMPTYEGTFEKVINMSSDSPASVLHQPAVTIQAFKPTIEHPQNYRRLSRRER